MRSKIQQSPPKYLNDGVRLTIEIEAFCIAERQRRHYVGNPGTVRGETNKPSDTCKKFREEMKRFRYELSTSLGDLENK
jgi:hypothetical protein